MDAGGKEYIFLTVFLEEEEEERRGGAHERTRRGALPWLYLRSQTHSSGTISQQS